MSVPPTSRPVWAKRVGDDAVADDNVAFCAGWDVRARPEADAALVEHDLATNAAHAIMLAERGILGPDEARGILAALLEARTRHRAGEPLLRPQSEDIHMSIEELVTELAGAGAGGRLHTGRSRNDQVATDMRLWLRERIAAAAAETHALVEALADHALAHVATPCPGFTHMQPAMIATWGHWTAAVAARVTRDTRAFAAMLDEVADCPLGAAASYGSSWPTDRERTATLLGFDKPSASTVDAIWSRGEAETSYAFAVARLLTHLAGFGQDLILLSSPPREWVRLPEAFVTGSSIMPQKRNPDFAEVTRARAAAAASVVQALLGVAHAAPMGYNRDTQWTKYLVLDAAAHVEGAPRVFAGVVAGLVVHADRMHAACAQGFLNATDVADFLARTRGVPFRDCYRVLGRAVRACEATGVLTGEAINAHLRELDAGVAPVTDAEMRTLEDPKLLVATRGQTGSPHPDRVRESVERIRTESAAAAATAASRASAWHRSLEDLWTLVAARARA